MLNIAGYILRRGGAWLKRRLIPAKIPRHEPDVLPYPAWIKKRVRDRREEYPANHEPGLFSLLTPVFDPPSGFFRRLGKSILAQDHGDWQWVIVDNGSTNRDVLFLMQAFARDSRVKLVQADGPQGIIGGMRLALEYATNRYVCPVDHDDWLYPDALRVVAASLQAYDWPVLAYTDEDKLFPHGEPGLPSFKPDWDPLLFLNAFYIAHLGVMDRETALDLDVYTDPQAEGTPDGDAFCRFLAAGHVPLHIPEIVYSWRMHMESTALRGIEAKPYATANQKHVLNRYLAEAGLSEQISIRTNPLPGLAGSWRVMGQPVSVSVLVTPGGSHEARRKLRQRLRLAQNVGKVRWLRSTPNSWLEVLNQIRGEPWVVLLSPDCLPLTTDFVSEFQSVQQAVPESVLVGGVLMNDSGKVESAGLAWGMGGLMDSSLAGLDVHDYAVGQGMLCMQHCVSSVDARFCMVQVAFLREVLERSGCDLADPLLPAWFAAVAREQKKRVLFTPYVKANVIETLTSRMIDDEARFQFLTQFGHWLSSDPYYSRFLGLSAPTAYQSVRPCLRRETLQRTLSALSDTMPESNAWLGSKEKYQPFLTGSTIENKTNNSELSALEDREVA